MTPPVASVEGLAVTTSARPSPRGEGFSALLGFHLAGVDPAAADAPARTDAGSSPDDAGEAPAGRDAEPIGDDPAARDPGRTHGEKRHGDEAHGSAHHPSHAANAAGPPPIALATGQVMAVPAPLVSVSVSGSGGTVAAKPDAVRPDAAGHRASTASAQDAATGQAGGETALPAHPGAGAGAPLPSSTTIDDTDGSSTDSPDAELVTNPAPVSARAPRSHADAVSHGNARPTEPGLLTAADLSTLSGSGAPQDQAPSPGQPIVTPGPAGAAEIGATRDAGGDASSPSSASVAQDASPAVPPTAQLGHALASVHTGPDGSSHVTIQLDPVELGQMRVRITRAHDGLATVSVSVERPETLHSLQADLGRLHEVLDRAGLPEHRTLSLHLATAEPGAPGDAGFSAGGGQGGAQGGFQQQGDSGGRAGGAWASRGSGAAPGSGRLAAGPDPPPTTRWLRAGVNITA